MHCWLTRRNAFKETLSNARQLLPASSPLFAKDCHWKRYINEVDCRLKMAIQGPVPPVFQSKHLKGRSGPRVGDAFPSEPL